MCVSCPLLSLNVWMFHPECLNSSCLRFFPSGVFGDLEFFGFNKVVFESAFESCLFLPRSWQRAIQGNVVLLCFLPKRIISSATYTNQHFKIIKLGKTLIYTLASARELTTKRQTPYVLWINMSVATTTHLSTHCSSETLLLTSCIVFQCVGV